MTSWAEVVAQEPTMKAAEPEEHQPDEIVAAQQHYNEIVTRMLKQCRIHRELTEQTEVALRELHRLERLERQAHQILVDTTEFHKKARSFKKGEALVRLPNGEWNVGPSKSGSPVCRQKVYSNPSTSSSSSPSVNVHNGGLSATI